MQNQQQGATPLNYLLRRQTVRQHLHTTVNQEPTAPPPTSDTPLQQESAERQQLNMEAIQPVLQELASVMMQSNKMEMEKFSG